MPSGCFGGHDLGHRGNLLAFRCDDNLTKGVAREHRVFDLDNLRGALSHQEADDGQGQREQEGQQQETAVELEAVAVDEQQAVSDPQHRDGGGDGKRVFEDGVHGLMG